MLVTQKTQQVVNTHVQHVVNAIEAEMPKIIKETVQRKRPVINEKINQVTKHPEVPQIQVVEKTVEGQQLLIIGQFVETPETQMNQSAQTSERSGTAPVCQVTQTEIREVIEIGASIPAESASSILVTAPGMPNRQVGEKLADDVVSEMRDLKSDLVHIRELLGVLVRKERYAETKAEIAARRVDRMEREQHEADDAEHEANLQEALQNQSKAGSEGARRQMVRRQRLWLRESTPQAKSCSSIPAPCKVLKYSR